MKITEIIVLQTVHRPGSLAKALAVIGEAGIVVEGLNAIARDHEHTTWEITVDLQEGTRQPLVDALNTLPTAQVLGHSDRVFNRHKGGKIQTVSRYELNTLEILRDIYTPGVARVCLAIRDQPEKVRDYTNWANTVAIVTNGTAVLGLGDIGCHAGLPVMEGKAALMHQLAGISGVPILLDVKDPYRVVDAVCAMAPSFGAIQLEDIAAPACFEIEAELMRRLDIPVMHDDRHGTAVVVLAALRSAVQRVGFDLHGGVVGQIGLGAAGMGICELLMKYGVTRVLGADLDADACARLEVLGGKRATLTEIMQQADVVIATTGVKNLIKPEMIRKGQIILALSNPEPEIEPEVAMERGALFATDGKIVNNVLGFPGIFRGALDARAHRITDKMLLAAAKCLSDLGSAHLLVPDPLDRTVHSKVAEAVALAADTDYCRREAHL